MEIFAFEVGVGPNGPQQYLLGLKAKTEEIRKQKLVLLFFRLKTVLPIFGK